MFSSQTLSHFLSKTYQSAKPIFFLLGANSQIMFSCFTFLSFLFLSMEKKKVTGEYKQPYNLNKWGHNEVDKEEEKQQDIVQIPFNGSTLFT